MMSVRRSGGSSARADLTRNLTPGRSNECRARVPFANALGSGRVLLLCSTSSACSSNFSVKALASELSSERAAVQLLALALIGLGGPLDSRDGVGVPSGTAMSNFQDGERREPRATAMAGVPLPTLLTRSLGARSGEVEVEGG